jgi:phage gpG-like protein
MSKFRIKLTKESQRKIDNLARAGKVDLRPSLKVIGIGYRKEVDQIFSKQQPRGIGLRWPPLSEKYAEWKEKRFPGRPLLVRTGALKESMTQEGAQGNITAISKTSAIFGTSIHYGIYHDKGGSKIPKRNFSEPSERRRLIWLDQIEKDIIHNFEQNGIDVEGSIFA